MTVQAAGMGSAASGAIPGREAPHAVAEPSQVEAALTARPSPIAAASTRTFCTFDRPPAGYDLNSDGDELGVRRRATLVLETASALFYVDDDDAAGFTSSDWEALAAWWEIAYDSVTSRTGPPPDVDGNGKFIVFFTSALGPRVRSVSNYFDVVTKADTSDDCVTNHESNHADMIHLHPPFGMEDASGRPLTRTVAWAVVKGRMPYALQRIVDAGRFRMVGYARDGEITHARMALAETHSGSGNHVAALRALAAPALLTRAGSGDGSGGYPSLGMFPWAATQAHPAIDSFILYLTDRLGPDFVERFFTTTTTLAQLDAVTGIPLPIAYALWTGALVFSNETEAPHWSGFDYTGADWTPFHQKFQRFEYAPLEAGDPVTVTLRRNGFDVYVTGVAGAGGGTVTVTSEAAVKPYVVAIPFKGSLP